jgi:hypothetical protein
MMAAQTRLFLDNFLLAMPVSLAVISLQDFSSSSSPSNDSAASDIVPCWASPSPFARSLAYLGGGNDCIIAGYESKTGICGVLWVRGGRKLNTSVNHREAQVRRQNEYNSQIQLIIRR